MTSEMWLLYLWTRLEIVHAVLLTVVALSFFSGFIAIGFWLGEDRIAARRFVCRVVLPVLLVSVLLKVALPTKTDAAIIVGGYFALEIARSKKAAELSGALYDAILAELRRIKEKP